MWGKETIKKQDFYFLFLFFAFYSNISMLKTTRIVEKGAKLVMESDLNMEL